MERRATGEQGGGGEPRSDESAIRKAWEAGNATAAATAAIAQVGPEVLRYLGGMLVDPALADDAFSLFCERVWTSLPGFEWRCSLRTWLYVLARRASVDVLRAEGRRQRHRVHLSDSQLAAVAEQVRTTTFPLLGTEGRSALARLRDKLSPDDRTLLLLRVDRRLAWEDLARIFLDAEAPGDDDFRRESARLRQRFKLVKDRLRKMARAEGLLEEDDRK